MRRLLSQPVSRGGAAHSIWPGTATRGPAGPKLSLPFDPTLAGKVPGAAAKFNVLHACPLEEKPAAAHRPLRCHPRPAPGRGQSRAYLLLQLARTQEECASLNQEVQNLVARAHLAPEAARPDADESELAQLEIENSALESELAAATTKLRQLEEEAAFKLSRQRMLFDESCQRAAQELEREFTALYESNDELVIDYLHKVFEQLQGKASLPSVA